MVRSMDSFFQARSSAPARESSGAADPANADPANADPGNADAHQPNEPRSMEPPVNPALPVKFGRIFDEEEGEFTLEYDDTRGQRNTMRLDAFTYEGALREARSFLGIQEDGHDEAGDLWAVE